MRWPITGPILTYSGRVFGGILRVFSPSLPYDLELSVSYRNRWTIFKYSFAVAVFFCFFLTGILTGLNGTLLGNDPNRLYFKSDIHNIILYILVTPLWVGLAVCLVATTVKEWGTLRKIADEASAASLAHKTVSAGNGSKFRVGFQRLLNDAGFMFTLGVVYSLLVTSIFITQYINQTLDRAITPTLYWFADETVTQQRVLNPVGAYYLLMNAVLLCLTCMAAFCYLTMSVEVVRIGKNIGNLKLLRNEKKGSPKENSASVDSRKLAHALVGFCWCYCLAKFLIATYSVNVLIWRHSPLGNVPNVAVTVIALAVIGLFFIPIPRLYVEYKWNKLLSARGERYKDIRIHEQITLSQVANAIFAVIVLGLIEERLNITGLGGIIKHFIGPMGS